MAEQIAPWHQLIAWLSDFSVYPSDGGPKEALLTIASVSVVAWTGGLIILSLPERPKNYLTFSPGLDYLQFAFIIPALSLLASAHWQAIIAGFFFVWYLALYVVALVVDSSRAKLPSHWRVGRLLQILSLLVLAIDPDRGVAGWICGFQAFIGYQYLITNLSINITRETEEL